MPGRTAFVIDKHGPMSYSEPVAAIGFNSKVQYLKGVGPRRAEVLEKIGITTIYDLLHYLPRRYLDRSMIVPIGSLQANMNVTVIGRVVGKGILRGRRSRLEVVIADDSGYIALIWFSGYGYFEKIFNKGDLFSVTGQVTYYQQRQIVHPEIEKIEDEAAGLIHTGRIVPVYPLTAEIRKAGITGRVLRGMINRSLEQISETIPDTLPSVHRLRYGLLTLDRALRSIHYPEQMPDAESARKRLAFDELLELQYLILSSRKESGRISKGHHYRKPGEIVAAFIKSLPYRLTTDQEKVVGRILGDMRKEQPMHRLLHGDVGCGKTVVAVFACVYAAENKLQAAFMAPTELLAEQHHKSWAEPLEKAGLESALVTASRTKAERAGIEKGVAEGRIDIVFGTHAVISESLDFSRLGLVIIDEQHRFGVMQRGRLLAKGQKPDMLVMSATPIPRTLALTLYGDLDISSIKSMPPGRQTTKTVWRQASARPEIYEYLKKKVAAGDQVFFVYPLIEKSEKLDLQAAEDAYRQLKSGAFAEFRLGLVHGRMKRDKREHIVTAFRRREIDILVATTVIEVGLDIPSANIMVIEHAERFGLSQLHQLRGRVGRGRRKGMAVAIATPPIGDHARKRLDLFCASNDGFKIAEADLSLRGPGEFFGTRQHGLPELNVADLSRDTDLLAPAREIITGLLAGDNSLDKDDRHLLTYLAEKARNRKSLADIG